MLTKPHTIILLILVFVFISVDGVHAQTDISKLPFNESEELHYEVFYNWGFIWISAATVDFTVEPSDNCYENSLLLSSKGRSLKAYDWIMEVGGFYSTYVNKNNLNPIHHIRDTREGSFELHNEYRFDYDNDLIYSEFEDSDHPKHADTIPLQINAADLVATAYQIRTMSFDAYQINDSIPFKILLGGQYHNIYIRYLGKDSIEIENGTQYKCLKFSAILVAGTIFDSDEEMMVWVSDDKNKVPVQVEAKIAVGKVIASLSSSVGIRHPQTALIQTEQ